MVDSGQSPDTNRFRSFAFVTGTTLLGGLLNALLVALAARRGEYAEVAALTVVMAVLAVGGAAVGGGSGLLYIGGTEAERSAVRSQRMLVIQPALWLIAAVVVLFYSARSYTWHALAAAALVFLANNLAELSMAQLHRDSRFVRCALPTYFSKAGAVVAFVVADAPLTTALLVGAVVNLVMFEILAGPSSALRALRRDPPTIAAAWQGFISSRALLAFTVLELYSLRAPSIGLSLVVPITVMGNYGAVTAAYQALLSVFQSGLLMLLSLRSRRRHGLNEHQGRNTEGLSLATGLLSAAALFLVAPLLTQDILNLSLPETTTWLRILAVAVPFYLLNRIIATHAIADVRYGDSARIAVSLAILTTAGLIVLAPPLGVTGAVAATLAAEALVGLALLVRRVPSLLARG